MENVKSPPRPSPPPGANPDWTIPQDWSGYTAVEHVTWDRLYSRQLGILRDQAAPEFLSGLDLLDMGRGGIPDLDRLSQRLMRLTGWRVETVPGLVPAEDFFRHLANRTFVAGRFIRAPQQIDYLEEPDIFHDVFGHVPLLAHPIFADYMQAYGEGGLRSLQYGAMDKLARLYWYTVEFGLVSTSDGPRIYGAGIASSASESKFSLQSGSPHRLVFDLQRVMRTRYRIDDFQQTYFVIDSFGDLLRQTLETDFAPVYAELEIETSLTPDLVLAQDRVIQLGSQSYARDQLLAQRARHGAASLPHWR
jgi:phenylalanine-4-hydroxylase